MTQTDYYTVLGIDKTATAPKIKEAYRTMAFKYHPDRCSDPDGVDKMKSINEAYAVLSNPDKRKEYDTIKQQYGSSAYGQFRQTHTEQDIFRGSDVNDVFEEMAKSFGFRSFDDIFKDFYGNGYQQFEFRGGRRCGQGQGRGRRMGLGQGGCRRQQQQQQQQQGFNFLANMGRLPKYLLEKATGFALPENGSDAGDILTLDPETARQGGKIPYNVKKRSKQLMVNIPANVREGQWIRLAGMGKEGKGGGTSGDLFLQVKIQKPLLEEVKNTFSQLVSSAKSLWKRPR